MSVPVSSQETPFLRSLPKDVLERIRREGRGGSQKIGGAGNRDRGGIPGLVGTVSMIEFREGFASVGERGSGIVSAFLVD